MATVRRAVGTLVPAAWKRKPVHFWEASQRPPVMLSWIPAHFAGVFATRLPCPFRDALECCLSA